MLEDPPILQINRRIARPDAALLEAFRGMPTGFVTDSMEGRGALDHRIKPIDPACAAFVGVALTCQCGPGDNLAILGALSIAERGDVIVAAADGFAELAVMGDRVTGMARNRGAVGLVTDGAVRDTPGIRAVGLPCFARGVTPSSCAASGPGMVGLPVVIGGDRGRLGRCAGRRLRRRGGGAAGPPRRDRRARARGRDRRDGDGRAGGRGPRDAGADHGAGARREDTVFRLRR